MITIFVNGHATLVDSKHTLQNILLLATQPISCQPLEQGQPSNKPQHQYDLSCIAVAHNQYIVPKSQ